MQIREIPVDDYEKVVVAQDPDSGLHAIIAVHDTTLGPALGGLRMWNYASEEEALRDVLRLSKGMTYKSACADTGLGGGKAVIIGDQKTQKTEALFRSMGRFVESLGGKYVTAEDVGIGIRELEWLRQETNHVTGLSRKSGSSGNPSPFTARGVMRGLRACAEEAFGTSRLDNFHYAVQGLGHVGGDVVLGLSMLGAWISVTDLNEDRLEQFEALPGVNVVGPDEIYGVDCDFFVPSALGGVINDETIPQLKAKVVAGCSNNQLGEPRHGEMLAERGILYAPDYVINAGGIINVAIEVGPGGYNERRAVEKIENIYTALKEIFATARREGITPEKAADQVAEMRLAEAKAKNGAVPDAAPSP